METKHPEGKTFSYIDIDSIDNKKQLIKGAKLLSTSDAPSRARRKVFKNSTLFSMVRPYLMNIAFVGEKFRDCIASTGFFVCTPTEIVDGEYLFLLMRSAYVVNGLNFFMKGDNSPSINSKQIFDFLYPIPPLNYQRQTVQRAKRLLEIANILETAESDLIVIAKSLKARVLDFYFGTSDKSYYGQPRRFTALGTLISGRDLIPSQYSNEKRGIPYITGASNFENGSIIVNRWTDQPAVIAKKGDVLITCKGTIGKTAVLQLEECHIARQIMAFRCNKGTLFPKYLQYYFAFLERDLANSSSSLIPGFKREELTKKLVSFPDYKTQIEVAQKIDLLFRQIDSFNDGSSAQ